jgi:hypothetical protein
MTITVWTALAGVVLLGACTTAAPTDRDHRPDRPDTDPQELSAVGIHQVRVEIPLTKSGVGIPLR